VEAEFMNIPNPLPTGNGFSSVELAEAEYMKQGGSIVTGTIYVYITTLDGPVGMAKDIVSNACMVDYRCVGSTTNPGEFGTQYGLGKVLIHELGHCFGLLHPFSDTNSCTDLVTQSANPQSPPQKNPNEFTSLTTLNTDGNCLDNRGRDEQRFCTGDPTCQANTSNGLNPGDTNPNIAAYSCASREMLTSATLPYETFMIFMDYGEDNLANGFPSDTVNTMRTVIQSHPELFNLNTPNPPSTSSTLPTWAIALIAVIGSIIFIGIIILVVKKAKTTPPQTKKIIAYSQPFLTKQFI
jgi:hypothetical protein